METFELRFHVLPGDIDEMGHVNNVVYLRWVQELAVAHWRSAAAPEDQRRLLWVVTRHEIDYKRAALAGDEIVGRTWVGRSSGLNYERHSELARASDGKLLVKALTFWCPIDAATRRPVEPGEAVRRRFSLNERNEL